MQPTEPTQDLQAENPIPQPPATQPDLNPTPTDQPKRKHPVLLGVVITIVVLVVAFLSYAIYLGSKAEVDQAQIAPEAITEASLTIPELQVSLPLVQSGSAGGQPDIQYSWNETDRRAELTSTLFEDTFGDEVCGLRPFGTISGYKAFTDEDKAKNPNIENLDPSQDKAYYNGLGFTLGKSDGYGITVWTTTTGSGPTVCGKDDSMQNSAKLTISELLSRIIPGMHDTTNLYNDGKELPQNTSNEAAVYTALKQDCNKDSSKPKSTDYTNVRIMNGKYASALTGCRGEDDEPNPTTLAYFKKVDNTWTVAFQGEVPDCSTVAGFPKEMVATCNDTKGAVVKR